MPVYISGSLAYDRIMDFPGRFSDHILPKQIHQLNVSFGLDKLTIEYGGTAGNIVYNLSLFGEQPYLITQAGNDYTDYAKRLRAEHVRLNFVRAVKQETCSTGHIITDQADNQIAAFHFSAMKLPATGDTQLRRRLAKQLHSGKGLGLLAAGNLTDMLWLAKTYQTEGIDYIFDPGQQTIWLQPKDITAILKGAGAMIVNDYELAMICKKLQRTTAQLVKQLPLLIVTLGSKG